MKKEKEKSQPNIRQYLPKQVITIFGTSAKPEQEGDDQTEHRYYVEIADVMNDKGKAFVGAGRPLTQNTLQHLMAAAMEDGKRTLSTIKGLAPTNMLMLDQRPGRQLLAWWRPAEKRVMFLDKKQPFKAEVPALLYVASQGTLSVAALKDNKRPLLTTKLMHAPFFNVYHDSKVCLGTVRAPKNIEDIRETMEEWEKCFWSSEFTETVSGGYSNHQLNKWWRKKKRQKFSPKKLKPTNKTLKQLCESL
jgi:PRTRC genetic system protein B